MFFLGHGRKKGIFFLMGFLGFFSSQVFAEAPYAEPPKIEGDILDLEAGVQHPDEFWVSLAKPSKELQIFYQMTGLSHWPLQYILGNLGIINKKLVRPKVVIIVYSALSCQHCSKLHREVIQPLQKKYKDEICIIIRDRPLDLFSLQASLITYCQPQNTHALQKMFFETQEKWIPEIEELHELNKEDAHALVKEKLIKIMNAHGYQKKCQPYFCFPMVQEAAAILSKNEEFQKITSTPLLYLYVPETKNKTIGYAPPQKISLSQMNFSQIEKEINQSRAKLFS